MKNKLTYLTIAAFLSHFGYSQDIQWEKSYGGKHSEYLFDAVPTPDYGFILAGSSLSNKTGNKTEEGNGNLDYWIWKMDEKGDLDWQKSFGGTGADLLQSVRLTSDGGYILAGTSDSGGGAQKKEDRYGQQDYWIIKLNAMGNVQWERTIGGIGEDRVTGVIQTKDGGYFIGGSSSSPIGRPKKGIPEPGGAPILKNEAGRGNLDYWVLKLDPKGNLEWQRTLGGQHADVLEGFEQTRDGGFILGGYSNSPATLDSGRAGDKEKDPIGNGDFWIVKLDAKGQLEWQQTLGGEGEDHLYSIHQALDGNYIAGGSSNSASISGGAGARDMDFLLIKINETGEVIWSRTYDYGKQDILISVTENTDQTMLLGGYSKSPMTHTALQKKKEKEGINDYIALKVSSEGEVLWDATVGSNGEDILKKLVKTRDGGYLLAGTSTPAVPKGMAVKTASRDRNSAIGRSDFWVVKLRDKDKKEEKKRAIEAFPNPAVQYTNVVVGYEFKSGTCTIFDLAGRQLQEFEITDRTVPVDLGSYPEGIYVIQIRTEIQSDGIKVVKALNKE
ncbi:T9SS type A sorting domain-containing protein [Flavobacterium qiangtangense]|uniref:T9SS type A sorting domain-containing protein n=1 Tax=Flavobacterium qiangtangense TaxID=1442595 RepID=A0ABW1PNA9_9FLAO